MTPSSKRAATGRGLAWDPSRDGPREQRAEAQSWGEIKWAVGSRGWPASTPTLVPFRAALRTAPWLTGHILIFGAISGFNPSSQKLQACSPLARSGSEVISLTYKIFKIKVQKRHTFINLKMQKINKPTATATKTSLDDHSWKGQKPGGCSPAILHDNDRLEP